VIPVNLFSTRFLYEMLMKRMITKNDEPGMTAMATLDDGGGNSVGDVENSDDP
jgi:hypothetical protein